MKSIIKSVKIRYNVVTVTTKSNVVRHYTLKSNEIARQYYNDIVSWRIVIHFESGRYNSQCKLSTKQTIVFYKLNTTSIG